MALVGAAAAHRQPHSSDDVQKPVAPRHPLVWVVALMIVGLGLRVATINTRGLWLDEASTILQVSGTVMQTIYSQLGGTHPPFFHVLMHYWIYAFGTSETAVRLFATVFGVLAIPAAYWAGKVAYDRRVGLISAVLVALSPFAIWYSQEARMYTMLLLFAFLSAGAFARALERNDFRGWAWYFVVTLGGLFTHYLFFLLVAGQGLYFVAFEVIDREIWLGRAGTRNASLRHPLAIFKDIPTLAGYLVTIAVLAVPEVLWLNAAVFFPPSQNAVLVNAVTTSGLGYGAPPPTLAIRFNDVLETVVEVLFGSHSPAITYGLVAMWPLILYFVMLVMGGGRYLTRRTTMLLCSASGVLVVWGLGQWQGVVLLSRYLVPMVAPGLVLLAGTIARMADRARRVTLGAVVVVCLAAYVAQSFDPNSLLRYQNREVIEYVAAHDRPGDVIIYEPFYIDVLVDYYLPKNTIAFGFPRFSLRGGYRDSKAQLDQDLGRIVGSAPRVWAIRSFQNVPALGYQAYLTDQWFKANGYRITRHVLLNKAEWLLFTKVPARVPAPSATGTVTPQGSALATPAGGGGAP